MKKTNLEIKKIIKNLFADGYYIVNNVLSIKECDITIQHLDKLKKKNKE